MTDRDEHGKFMKGNKASPGRPPKPVEADYKNALLEIVGVERFKKMIEAQAKRAERGDIQAFNAIANRLLPVMTLNQVTGADGQPIKVIFEYVGDKDESDTTG